MLAGDCFRELPKKENRQITNFQQLSETRVELAGVEPASKQGNHMLSTRLFWPSFSCDVKTQTTNRNLSL